MTATIGALSILGVAVAVALFLLPGAGILATPTGIVFYGVLGTVMVIVFIILVATAIAVVFYLFVLRM